MYYVFAWIHVRCMYVSWLCLSFLVVDQSVSPFAECMLLSHFSRSPIMILLTLFEFRAEMWTHTVIILVWLFINSLTHVCLHRSRVHSYLSLVSTSLACVCVCTYACMPCVKMCKGKHWISGMPMCAGAHWDTTNKQLAIPVFQRHTMRTSTRCMLMVVVIVVE